MIKYPSPETMRALAEIAKVVIDRHAPTTAGVPASIRIPGVRVCDHCRNEDEEAFPYSVFDAKGDFWDDLCNDCFDALGCVCEEGEP